MPTKFRVTLTHDERQQLSTLVNVGKAAARKLLYARILLKADQAPHQCHPVRPHSAYPDFLAFVPAIYGNPCALTAELFDERRRWKFLNWI